MAATLGASTQTGWEYSLFNAVDGSLVALDPSAFDQSLVLNLLFQDRILVYDGSFFTCRNLNAHLGGRPGYNSLFEVACQRGLVTPAFRDVKNSMPARFRRLPEKAVAGL